MRALAGIVDLSLSFFQDLLFYLLFVLFFSLYHFIKPETQYVKLFAFSFCLTAKNSTVVPQTAQLMYVALLVNDLSHVENVDNIF